MMRVRLPWPVTPLVLTVLACSLTSAPPSPTPIPIPPTPTIIITVPPPPTEIPTATLLDQSGDNSGGIIPGCAPRSDWPIYTVQSGDTMSSIAQRSNSTTEDLRIGNCLASADVIYAGQQLRVPQPPAAASPVVVSTTIAGCANPWFFRFNLNVTEATICPGPVYSTGAAGEDFEGGRAYYYAAITGVIGPSVYVIYNDGTWERYDDRFNGNLEPASDPSIVPPTGRYQPVRAIGKVWRENPGVRAKLGWAYTPEADFAGRRQFPVGSGILFIDHGIRHTVLRLDNANSQWATVGTY